MLFDGVLFLLADLAKAKGPARVLLCLLHGIKQANGNIAGLGMLAKSVYMNDLRLGIDHKIAKLQSQQFLPGCIIVLSLLLLYNIFAMFAILNITNYSKVFPVFFQYLYISTPIGNPMGVDITGSS